MVLNKEKMITNELPVGVIFRVENGNWIGQIVEGEDGNKYIHVLNNSKISDWLYNAESFSENNITILKQLTED